MPIISGIIGVIILIGLVAFVIWQWSQYGQRRNSPHLKISRYARNPEHSCGTASCPIQVVWELDTTEGNVDVHLQLVAPNSGQATTLSMNQSSPQFIDPTDQNLFPIEGVYLLQLTASADGLPDVTESLPINHHAGPTFMLTDTWDTGFTGGALSQSNTVATRSIVLGPEPFTGSIPEIDRKIPSSVTVCPKSVELYGVERLQGGTVDYAQTKVKVTVRRPGDNTPIATGDLAWGQSVDLPVPALIDDGIEILSVLRREDGQSVAGAQWSLGYKLRCIP